MYNKNVIKCTSTIVWQESHNYWEKNNYCKTKSISL